MIRRVTCKTSLASICFPTQFCSNHAVVSSCLFSGWRIRHCSTIPRNHSVDWYCYSFGFRPAATGSWKLALGSWRTLRRNPCRNLNLNTCNTLCRLLSCNTCSLTFILINSLAVLIIKITTTIIIAAAGAVTTTPTTIPIISDHTVISFLTVCSVQMGVFSCRSRTHRTLRKVLISTKVIPTTQHHLVVSIVSSYHTVISCLCYRSHCMRPWTLWTFPGSSLPSYPGDTVEPVCNTLSLYQTRLRRAAHLTTCNSRYSDRNLEATGRRNDEARCKKGNECGGQHGIKMGLRM